MPNALIGAQIVDNMCNFTWIGWDKKLSHKIMHQSIFLKIVAENIEQQSNFLLAITGNWRRKLIMSAVIDSKTQRVQWKKEVSFGVWAKKLMMFSPACFFLFIVWWFSFGPYPILETFLCVQKFSATILDKLNFYQNSLIDDSELPVSYTCLKAYFSRPSSLWHGFQKVHKKYPLIFWHATLTFLQRPLKHKTFSTSRVLSLDVQNMQIAK